MEETGILENLALLSVVLPHFEPGPKWGLVQNGGFSGNSTDDERASTVEVYEPTVQIAVSGSAEAGVAKQFQPMRVGLPCQ
jgi:hypothetical protein